MTGLERLECGLIQFEQLMKSKLDTHKSPKVLMILMQAMIVLTLLLPAVFVAANEQADPLPFAPGEKLEYVLRWESIVAGFASLEVLPMSKRNGENAHHFKMTVESNRFIDMFFKVRNRIEAYTDVEMTRSLYYRKNQHEGRHKKDEEIRFDWDKGQATYSNFGNKRKPIPIPEGTFDPLSAIYFIRFSPVVTAKEIQRPITDGKKIVAGKLTVLGRETITLKDGRRFDTYRVEPDISEVGGVFNKSEDARIELWLTADQRRIPVRIKSRVVIGHFIGELVSIVP